MQKTPFCTRRAEGPRSAGRSRRATLVVRVMVASVETLPLVHPWRPHLAQGFRYAPDGSVEMLCDIDGQPVWQFLCSPLEIEARTSDENDKNHGRLLRTWTFDGRVHSWVMPMALLGGGREFLRKLLSMGVSIASGDWVPDGLRDLLIRTIPTKHVTCVQRTGWHRQTYVLPHTAFGAEADNFFFQAPASVDHRYERRGSLDDWRAGVGTLAIGNDYVTFAISVAFAGPLLEPLGQGSESGIFNLNGDSSVGKTTTARAACSVYGSGRVDGFQHTWRITDNALESVAFARCDGLVVLDEMSLAQPEHVGAIAYMYANGQGKGRADSHGDAKPVRRWRGLALSTGELGIADLVRKFQGEAAPGQLVRFIDIPAADAGAGMGLFQDLHGEQSPDAFAQRLIVESGRAYGEAGVAYIKALAEHYDTSVTAGRNRMECFLATALDHGDGSQVRRVAKRFALAAAAGDVAASLGIAPWPEQAACHTAFRLYRLWKEHRGGSENSEALHYLGLLRDYIHLHAANFAKCDGDEPKHSAGYVKDLGGKRYWLLYPATWKTIFSGRDARAAARILTEKDVLWATRPRNYQRTMKVPGGGSRQASFYVVRDEALSVTVVAPNNDE
jgi:putative DNA primase/helicase